MNFFLCLRSIKIKKEKIEIKFDNFLFCLNKEIKFRKFNSKCLNWNDFLKDNIWKSDEIFVGKFLWIKSSWFLKNYFFKKLEN